VIQKVKKKETERIVKISELNATSKIGQNKQQEEIAKSEAKLKITQAEQLKQIQLAQIQVQKESELREIELTEKNNQAKVRTQVEELKSKNFSRSYCKSRCFISFN